MSEQFSVKITKLEVTPFEGDEQYSVLIEFTADEQAAKFLKYYVQEYDRVRVLDSEEEYDKYLSGINIEFEEIPGSEYKQAIITNTYDVTPESKITMSTHQILMHDEDTGVYSYEEYIERNPLTEAGIKMLSDMEQGIEPQTTREQVSYLMAIIESLNTFWY